MAVTCSACGYDKNPDGTEFCDACGSEISPVPAPVPEPPQPAPNPVPVPTPPIPEPPTPPVPTPPIPEPPAPPVPTPPIPGPPTPVPTPQVPAPTPFPSTGDVVRLIAKQVGAPVSEFLIDNGSAVIGIFDPDTGPVDVDLEGFQGHETVSRNHAEIYLEGGIWKLKDVGSTNGVFIKPAGQSRFNSRITVPTTVNPGDEIAIAKIRLLFQAS